MAYPCQRTNHLFLIARPPVSLVLGINLRVCFYICSCFVIRFSFHYFRDFFFLRSPSKSILDFIYLDTLTYQNRNDSYQLFLLFGDRYPPRQHDTFLMLKGNF